ncbi:MAG TPA: hypothetical protein DDZ89_14040 [Clostridiales bacterium]|nr:hypothetical protein [Clostridiales bacterium]
MFVRFSVGNFLSFKSERVFDVDKLKILKFAAVFGANASGKSNLVSNFKYAQSMFVMSVPKKG